MIVATAGHIDHGKTVLVRALTGVDTDRLPEEKRRGLSIDLGFAYQRLDDGTVLGFVDVPGHERFVRNMLAGVTGIQFALLIVAADDGPMPQTREHLAILDLLGITEGAVALTKTDRVDTARIADVSDDIRQLVAGTTLAAAPVFPVSGLTGEGVPALADHLAGAARRIAGRAPAGHFRMAIDRAFTVAGAGLVVTGAVHSGKASIGDALVLSPAGVPVRVRAIHAQDADAPVGAAGERCGINIAGAGLARVDVGRGDWLLAAAAHAPVRRLDARIRVLAGERKALAHWTPVHVHVAAAEVTGRVAILGQRSVPPDGSALVQLVLDDAVGALAGDRLILRDWSARRTIAGGAVIDPFPPKRGRARPDRLQRLAALEREDAADALADLLTLTPGWVHLGPLARARNMTAEEAEAAWAGVPMVRAEGAEGAIAFARDRWDGLMAEARAALARWHAGHPDSLGPSAEALRRAMPAPLPPDIFAAVVDGLAGAGAVTRSAGSLSLVDHRPELAPADAKLWAVVRPILEDGGLRPPIVRDIAREAGLDAQRIERFLARAARLGLVTRVADNRFFPPDALGRLAAMAETLAADGPFGAAQFRDRSGIGRNLTIELLEFFDRAGLTRRNGAERTVLKPAADIFGPPPG